MKIIAISGSSRTSSTNRTLLQQMALLFPKEGIEISTFPQDLPLFRAELDRSPLPKGVVQWRNQLQSATGVIICTPEYIHNMPAVLKNALEWITSSGELRGKKVLVMTLTPHPPRGEKAMQSMLWSLQALDANIVASLPLFLSEVKYSEEGKLDEATLEILTEALHLFE